MYIPAHFKEDNTHVLHALIDANPFGTLVTYGSNGLDANHLPFLLLPEEGQYGVLQAHVSRNNAVWQSVKDGDEVLVIFRAGDAYISPSWFPSKHEAHKQVPTWNYQVVHAYGRIAIRDEERFVRGNIARLTRKHEASQPVPWKMSDAPADFTDALVKMIVGIEVEITRFEGKLKLSQNKEARDIRGAAEALKTGNEQLVSAAMLKEADAKAG